MQPMSSMPFFPFLIVSISVTKVTSMEPAWRQQGRGRGRGQAVGDVSSWQPQRQEGGGRMGRGRAGSAVTTVSKAEQLPGTGKSDIIASPGNR